MLSPALGSQTTALVRYCTTNCISHTPLYLSEHCIPVSSADTRRHLRSANRHLLAIPRFQLNTYGRRAFSVSGLDGLELTPGFYPGSNEQHRLFLGVNLKRTCSRIINASSALEVLNDYALYKSTRSLTTSLGKCVLRVVIAMLHTAACPSRQPA